MASFLGDYEFAATQRVHKFHRAVESFINQSYENKELIIVSDGCDITISEAAKYSNHHNIKVFRSDKQPLFSGKIRSIGCYLATGEIICYLDSDDFIGVNHLKQIVESFKYHSDVDWVYFDDSIIYGFNPTNNEILSVAKRNVDLHFGTVGTSSIAHKKLYDISWEGCDGYGHDWLFIQKMINLKKPHVKIKDCEYFVCHIPNQVDC